MQPAPSLSPDESNPELPPKSPLGAAIDELIQPFRDLFRVNTGLSLGTFVPYFVDGLSYLGMLTLLGTYLAQNVALGDVWAGLLTGFLTGGITFAMFLLGSTSDRWGVRRSLIWSMVVLLAGRTLMAVAETAGLAPGLWNGLMLTNLAAMVIIIIGYGAFQPATYAAVKELSSAKAAPMSYAMLYALQNLGAFVSGLLSPRIRAATKSALPPNGITGVFWFYAVITLIGLVFMVRYLPRKARPVDTEQELVARALSDAKQAVVAHESKKTRLLTWLKEHPLFDAKFSFFIFVLIPVQTLFAHQWLTMPQYIERAFRPWPWVSENFETFSNLNPLLVFLLTPLLAAATAKRNVYSMMILGTAVMGMPTVLLAFGPSPSALVAFMLICSLGESLWQPRFLQYAAEIAPPGKTGLYMGVAQLPWFLTKLLTSLYSGWFLSQYCPLQGSLRTGTMWFYYWLIVLVSPLGLILGRSWVERSLSSKVIASSEDSPAPGNVIDFSNDA